MTVAAVLALYCVFAALLLPRLLGRAVWADRAPRLAIVLWQAASASAVVSVLLAAFAVAVPPSAVGHGLAGLFDVCGALFDACGALFETCTAFLHDPAATLAGPAATLHDFGTMLDNPATAPQSFGATPGNPAATPHDLGTAQDNPAAAPPGPVVAPPGSAALSGGLAEMPQGLAGMAGAPGGALGGALGGHAAPSAVAVGIGLVAGGLMLGRLAYAGGAVLLRARAERRRHADGLALLGRHDRGLGAVVVDYEERLAYCVPGWRGHAVITTGALRSLAPEQVAAVLAHERAHLRGRHHLVLAGAESLARAFPGVPLFERARAELGRLVELLADDVAARHHPRTDLAAALVRLATGRAPAFALGAGGETALMRVRRMLHPQAPLERRERLAGLLAVTSLLTGPAALAAAPALIVFLAHHCHTLLTL